MATKSWAPLWSSITTSSLWGESKEVRILFLTMLANKDATGVVYANSVSGLARMANLAFEECREALRVLESPDRENPDQPNEGRRIKTVDGGWVILNHAKYVDMMAQHRKEQNRMAQQRRRERLKREAEGMAPPNGKPLPGETGYVEDFKAGKVDEFGRPAEPMESGGNGSVEEGAA